MTRTIATLNPPLALLLAAMFTLFGASAAHAAAKPKGRMQIGFIGVPPQNYQHVLLNVASVRVNPRLKAGPAEIHWQTIPVAPGSELAEGGDLEIDLNSNQNVAQLLNTARIQTNTYQLAELILDASNPGTLVPNCPLAGGTEGCISYPIKLANAGSRILTNIPKTSVKRGGLAALYLYLQLTIVQEPAVSGDPYTVNVTIAPVVTGSGLPPIDTTAGIGVVTGTVSDAPASSKKGIRPISVTAEIAGTNTIVASSPLTFDQKSCGVPVPCYVLQLPAAGTAGSSLGSYYDLYVSGGAATYDAARVGPLQAGGSLTQDFKVTSGQTLGLISGTVTDNCTGDDINGATVQLLIPPKTNSSADCLTAPGQCVTVASGSTDPLGKFPLPGTTQLPAPLDNVPPPNGIPYTLMVTESGYDPFISGVVKAASVKNVKCGTPEAKPCAVGMNTGYLNGSVLLDSPPRPGHQTLVQVFAEDTGTNNLESALTSEVVISPPNDSGPFTLNVPPSVPPSDRYFDLFAETIDLYNGLSDKYTGHTISVLSGVGAPAACATTDLPNPTFAALTCVGHGSISGAVDNADLGTTIGLSKDNVQLMQTAVQNVSPVSSAPTNHYSFCVPADTYTLQRYEQVPPATPSVIGTPAPTAAGTPLVVTVPTPAPTPSPTVGPTPTSGLTPTSSPTPECPLACFSAQPPPAPSVCPGTCMNTVPSDL